MTAYSVTVYQTAVEFFYTVVLGRIAILEFLEQSQNRGIFHEEFPLTLPI